MTADAVRDAVVAGRVERLEASLRSRWQLGEDSMDTAELADTLVIETDVAVVTVARVVPGDADPAGLESHSIPRQVEKIAETKSCAQPEKHDREEVVGHSPLGQLLEIARRRWTELCRFTSLLEGELLRGTLDEFRFLRVFCAPAIGTARREETLLLGQIPSDRAPPSAAAQRRDVFDRTLIEVAGSNGPVEELLQEVAVFLKVGRREILVKKSRVVGREIFRTQLLQKLELPMS